MWMQLYITIDIQLIEIAYVYFSYVEYTDLFYGHLEGSEWYENISEIFKS